MVLFRRLLGEVLRRHRLRQGRTLRDVAAAARVSLGYLSEVERGLKEASSELLTAVCDALEVSLADVLREISDDLVAVERRPLQSVGFGAGAVRVSASGPVATPAATMRRVAGVAPRTPHRVPVRASSTHLGGETAVAVTPVATLSARSLPVVAA
jgi:transcriptional regulator with XRE-family HTH domain